MKFIYLILITFISYNFYAKGLEWTPQVRLISSELDEELDKNESQYIFEFSSIIKSEEGTKIIYSIDTIVKTELLDINNKLRIKSTPGAHKFQFFYNDQYFEIYTDSLNILPQHTDNYQVKFESSEKRVTVSKPVIYLYPENDIEFTVSINPIGDLFFTYPVYNGKWEGVVAPNGDIKINNNAYNYLFWESIQTINANLIDTQKGTIVKGNESLNFLEKTLNQFGFTSKEKADFITYWAPQLQQNEYNYIYFVLNNDADIFAELAITPTPDNIYRFYMLSSKIENPNDFYYLEPQLIEPIKRDGFTVLEWGGSKIDINVEKLNHRRL